MAILNFLPRDSLVVNRSNIDHLPKGGTIVAVCDMLLQDYLGDS